MNWLENWGIGNKYLEQAMLELGVLVKIKFSLGYGEFVNCWAYVIKKNDHYQLLFDDGISFDLYCKFDTKNKYFYGS